VDDSDDLPERLGHRDLRAQPRDVSVFGGSSEYAGVFHFNGRTWREVSATLEGGSALSDHNAWAFNGTEVEHYNGRS
jgi:hypothetical protein